MMERLVFYLSVVSVFHGYIHCFPQCIDQCICYDSEFVITCEGSGITDLDISPFWKEYLKRLYIDNTKIFQWEFLQDFSNIEVISLQNNLYLTCQDIENIPSWIKVYTDISCLVESTQSFHKPITTQTSTHTSDSIQSLFKETLINTPTEHMGSTAIEHMESDTTQINVSTWFFTEIASTESYTSDVDDYTVSDVTLEALVDGDRQTSESPLEASIIHEITGLTTTGFPTTDPTVTSSTAVMTKNSHFTDTMDLNAFVTSHSGILLTTNHFLTKSVTSISNKELEIITLSLIVVVTFVIVTCICLCVKLSLRTPKKAQIDAGNIFKYYVNCIVYLVVFSILSLRYMCRNTSNR